MNIRKDIIDKRSIIEEWISENRPKLWMAKQLGCKIDTLDSYLKKWEINYKGNIGAKGYKTSPIRKSALEYIQGSVISGSKLRKKLVEDGIKSECCENCGLDEWMGKKISLELHHVDGNRYNNEISNLMILCPNCHSMTPNHSMRKVYV
jgi:Zn finger protein HypA/HybF involved in hydrogenase expression